MKTLKYFWTGWLNKHSAFWVWTFCFFLGDIILTSSNKTRFIKLALWFGGWLIGLYFYGRKLYKQIYEN